MVQLRLFVLALLIAVTAGETAKLSAREAFLSLVVSPESFQPGETISVQWYTYSYCPNPMGGPYYLEVMGNDGFYHEEFYPESYGGATDFYAGFERRPIEYSGYLEVECYDDYWEEWYTTNYATTAAAYPAPPHFDRAVPTIFEWTAADIQACTANNNCGGLENFHSDIYYKLLDQWGDQYSQRIVVWENNDLALTPGCPEPQVIEQTTPIDIFEGFTDHIGRCSGCCPSPNYCAIDNDQTFFGSDGSTTRVLTVVGMVLYCDRVEINYWR